MGISTFPVKPLHGIITMQGLILLIIYVLYQQQIRGFSVDLLMHAKLLHWTFTHSTAYGLHALNYIVRIQFGTEPQIIVH